MRRRFRVSWRRRAGDEQGVAMITLFAVILVLTLLAVVIIQQSVVSVEQSAREDRDATALARAEAAIERYAAKIVEDPLYYLHRVDVTERARVPNTAVSGCGGGIVQPGSAWDENCVSWTYQDPTGPWPVDGDYRFRIEVIAPSQASPRLEVFAYAQHTATGEDRAVRAVVKPQSIAEFLFLVETEEYIATGALTDGPVYAGYEIDHAGCASASLYSEIRIDNIEPSSVPVACNVTGYTSQREMFNGAEGYADDDDPGDTMLSDTGVQWHNIRDAIEQPIQLDQFWGDLAIMRQAACEASGGLCLVAGTSALSRSGTVNVPASTRTYRIEFRSAAQAGVRMIRVWTSPQGPPNNESQITTHALLTGTRAPGDGTRSDMTWTVLGNFDYPINGAMSVDGWAFLGWCDPRNGATCNGTMSTIEGQISLLAGSEASPRDIAITGSIVNASTGVNILGLVATDDMYITQYSHGNASSSNLTFEAAVLTQGGTTKTGGTWWAAPQTLSTLPSLNFRGSRASFENGHASGHFNPRVYTYNQNLLWLRPPYFPTIGEDWSITEWEELPAPSWAPAP